MEWKQQFVERYKLLTDVDKFMECSEKPLRKSVRVNTLKTSVKEMKQRMSLQQTPWCGEGFWLEGEAIGNLPEHFLGYIYLQEAASMIPPEVLQPKEDDLVIDLCASPGSKTTQAAAMMKNKGLIIANDNQISRLKPLQINLQ
ncbi:tRNA methyltransferase, partial [Candidatus Woesearchaeota archaeon]|nr:tRNA methyltransferase [Candidatus Woesearchaeota archaeon]